MVILSIFPHFLHILLVIAYLSWDFNGYLMHQTSPVLPIAAAIFFHSSSLILIYNEIYNFFWHDICHRCKFILRLYLEKWHTTDRINLVEIIIASIYSFGISLPSFGLVMYQNQIIQVLIWFKHDIPYIVRWEATGPQGSVSARDV